MVRVSDLSGCKRVYLVIEMSPAAAAAAAEVRTNTSNMNIIHIRRQ